MIIKGKQRKGQCIDMLIYPTMMFYSRNIYIYISHPIYRDGERARLAPVKKKKKKKKFLP